MEEDWKIVAEVEWSSSVSSDRIPVGPGSKDYYKPGVTSFHCSGPECQIMYHHPPGRPDAKEEALRAARDADRKEELALTPVKPLTKKEIRELTKWKKGKI